MHIAVKNMSFVDAVFELVAALFVAVVVTVLFRWSFVVVAVVVVVVVVLLFFVGGGGGN